MHDAPESSRYEIRDGERVLGHAAYRREGGRTVFTHTEVEPDAEGTGVAGKLVRGALDDVRARGERAVPQCSFVRGWIGKHPDYEDLVDGA